MKKFFLLNKISNSTLSTIKIGYQLAYFINNKNSYKNKNKIILIEGDIGSGKTVITKGIAKQLGIKNNINSPTFLLLKSYQGKKNQMHHCDLYKILKFQKYSIKSILEEFQEIMKSGDVLIIESTENILSFLPYYDFRIKIDILNIKKRKISIEINEKER
ncbi:tRNA (adenosine(37)-N6)-threonylcarbamoyltransferase complex ATPase subunit type 1 TsaE [Candidatus Phytoplasma sacchari]|uniref:tRNA threonylcarbamoyladenosine biosynthesis protein TsaE n=1 Tax=Candidatus Phytoplasma sacchari TaxID=2609813 RepID=A0ABY7M318_9MOLU|nr:tRNA (adenosine(37)-N6)-threonylcarbamoyltransferase complex ATPase subunit type 1 TsaE [Candidatus Phytoplasma sacchari]